MQIYSETPKRYRVMAEVISYIGNVIFTTDSQ